MIDAAPPDAASPIAIRERGWWRVLVATLLFLFVPVTPMLRILLPVEQTVVLLAPALAVSALVGAVAGGRWPLAIVWTGLAGWVIWQFVSGAGTVALLTAGWSVLLAGAFGAISLVRTRGLLAFPSMFPRALAAIAIASALAAGVTLSVRGGRTAILDVVQTEAESKSQAALGAWRQTTGTPEWSQFTVQHPDASTMSKRVEEQLQSAPRYASVFFPSLLALESLAALALSWAVYHRVGRARIGPPMSALRDFRFDDHLVWGLIAGLILVVVPASESVGRVGANALVFFGLLYALRGLGVAIWFLAPSRLVMALLIGFALLFWNVLGVLALALGLGDTWLDWRARARQHAVRK